MQCAESLRIQAYFDSEVDSVSAGEIERHLEHCAECRALLSDLEQVRNVLRRDVTYARAPPLLRARVARALDREAEPPRPNVRKPTIWRTASFWAGAAGGIGGTAIAATAAFLLLAPPLTNPLVNDLLSAHVRSLMPAHLIDVVSTDRHTVKPWFAGHADVSPVVADFEPQGYKLIGGRADYLDHQRSAVVVYQHGAHFINVFSWAAAPSRYLPRDTTRNGYHLAFWRQGDLDYCAVSDTGWDELLGLVRLLRSASARE
ncbi:MAG: anti-sigma factor family protein [Steroidobacteraceae bacterium]